MLMVAVPPETLTVTGTLVPGVTSQGTCTVICCWLLMFDRLKMGAWLPLKVTLSPARTYGSGPTGLVGTTTPRMVGATPNAEMVAMLQGESAPRWKSAPFRKPLTVRFGPGGITVRVNV